MTDPFERLTAIFRRFPGIGPRQARRFVQFLLSQKQSYRAELASAIRDLGSTTSQCQMCYRWFSRFDNATGVCDICSDASRRGVLFVLEKDADIQNVENSGFRGQYFVLGGVIPLAAEEPEAHIRIREFLIRVKDAGSKKEMGEIILGLSATREGDHTRAILNEKLRDLANGLDIKMSSLGRGLSTGSELEYADPDTIADALSSRG